MEPEERTILVHLNVKVPAEVGGSADEIADAIADALSQARRTDELVGLALAGLEIAVSLAEEI